jgi:hypothetical protein
MNSSKRIQYSVLGLGLRWGRNDYIEFTHRCSFIRSTAPIPPYYIALHMHHPRLEVVVLGKLSPMRPMPTLTLNESTFQ